MRTTSSFEVFPNEPSERELSRARWLRAEGRFEEAESAYRSVMQSQPALRSGWTECFELLRSIGKINDALALATEAAGVFDMEAFPLALKGAALIELGQFAQALRSLEAAVERDPDLALTWHELGYAAYRLGDGNRALLALDRAFALEPHTETLILRGKILREAGEYYAAEVAFEGAFNAATHDDQQEAIRNEILHTRRRAAFAPSWAEPRTPAEEWFALHGAVVLACGAGDQDPTDEALTTAMIGLARDCDWQFDQVIACDSNDVWQSLASAFGTMVHGPADLDMERVPLVALTRTDGEAAQYRQIRQRLQEEGRGLVYVLRHSEDQPPEGIDVVGALERGGQPIAAQLDPATALVMAQHPAAKLADRVLRHDAGQLRG